MNFVPLPINPIQVAGTKFPLFSVKIFNSKINALFLCLLLMPQFLLANNYQENYYSPENILRFADHLYKEGDYIRAAGEFQRYLFYSSERLTARDSIYHKIGRCYQFGKDFQKSMNYFHKVIFNYPQSDYLDDSYCQIAYSHFFLGKYKESISFLDANISIIKSAKMRLKMQQLIGLNYIYQKQWAKATEFFYSFEEKEKGDSFTTLLANFAKQGQQLPRKSKFLAGFMSAIIPGTGKMYCHRTADGFFSLVTIGLTSWQAYEGFRKKGVSSVKGWIYGTIGVFFYLGNIYGSVVAVSIYNQQLENELLKKVGLTINVYFK